MGSFLQTCAVTHMPIRAGEPVVAMILARAYSLPPGCTGYVGSGSVWQAMSLPFRGDYDEYGYLNNLEDRSAGISLKTACGVTLEQFSEAAQGGKELKVRLPHPFAAESELMLMLVHAEIYDRLSGSTVTPYGRQIDFQEELGRLDEFLDVEKKAMNDYVARIGFTLPPEGLAVSLLQSEQNWEAIGHPWQEIPYVSRFFDRPAQGVHPLLRSAAAKLVSVAMADLDPNAAKRILGECLAVRVFEENMERLRRLWSPSCGLGSTEEELELQSELASWTMNRCREFTAEDDFDPPGP